MILAILARLEELWVLVGDVEYGVGMESLLDCISIPNPARDEEEADKEPVVELLELFLESVIKDALASEI